MIFTQLLATILPMKYANANPNTHILKMKLELIQMITVGDLMFRKIVFIIGSCIIRVQVVGTPSTLHTVNNKKPISVNKDSYENDFENL